MMVNLFTSFDPSTSFYLSLNWLSSMLGIIIFPLIFWIIPSRLNMTYLYIINYLNKELMTLNINLSKLILFVTLFFMILMNNFFGLFSYIFTASSHLTFSLMLSLSLWLSFMLFGWFENMLHMFSHLVPTGTPNILMPFMVCIETISNIIRPGTLAIRLSANMIAGHLLLTLLGNTGSFLSIIMLNMLISIQLLLLLLELAVSFIQSYVFMILSALYSSEV